MTGERFCSSQAEHYWDTPRTVKGRGHADGLVSCLHTSVDLCMCMNLAQLPQLVEKTLCFREFLGVFSHYICFKLILVGRFRPSLSSRICWLAGMGFSLGRRWRARSALAHRRTASTSRQRTARSLSPPAPTTLRFEQSCRDLAPYWSRFSRAQWACPPRRRTGWMLEGTSRP